MILDKPIKIIKTFDLDSVKEILGEESSLPTIQLSGYASRGFTDYGEREIDLDGETINQYGIDVSRLQTGNIPLLFQHDQHKVVGKVLSASYDNKGLYVTAELTKLPGDSLTNYVYEAVKAKMLNSFSVGLMVEDIGWLDDGDSELIEISKSHLFELSIVSTPALASATFSSTVIKSADGMISTAVISKSDLQKDNDNLCSTLGCLIKSAKKEEPVDIEKEQEVVVTPEEEVKAESEEVTETLEVKEPEPEKVKEPEPEKVEEVTKEEEAPLKTSEETKQEEETPKVEEEEVTPEPAVAPMTLEDALVLLSGIKIEELSNEDLETLFETVSTITEAVEKKVVEEITATLLAEQSEEEGK